MNRLLQIPLFVVALGLFMSFSLRADTFQLADGTSITGEIISADESGIRLRLPDDRYSDRIPWSRFPQAELLRLQRNPKTADFVAPFLEIAEPRPTGPAAMPPLKEPERLPRPTAGSVFGSLFRSPVGWFLLLLAYAANLYAGFEIALYRAQPRGLVCGVSAVLPVIGPIVFLAMPTRLGETPPEERIVPPEEDVLVVNPMQGDLPSGQQSSLHLHAETAPAADAAADLPPPEVFTRGQYTFNRRFFETRFPKFFGVVSHEKEKVLIVKSLRKEYVTTRIVRVSPVEVVLQLTHGQASEEVTVPFNDIQEVILKHKDAPR